MACEEHANAWLDHLELPPSAVEVNKLLASVPAAARCFVVLSANVPIAAYRALALAVACAPVVLVKPSRRDPHLAEILVKALQDSGLAVSLVDELAPQLGDHVMAYGSDDTLTTIRRSLPHGVSFSGHGTGFGVALIAKDDSLTDAAVGLAADVIAFDQQGCLSPRVVFVEGAQERAVQFGRALFAELGNEDQRWSRPIPSEVVAAELVAYVQLMKVTSECLAPRPSLDCGWIGAVGIDVNPHALVLPPAFRVVHVVSADLPVASALLLPLVRFVTAVGATQPSSAVSLGVPWARVSLFGQMQRPPLDGPVDLRRWP